MKEQTDVYERITTAIVEAIEAGCGNFEMPWHTFGVLPSNASNRRRYRGINVLALWAAASRHSYRTHLWATYQQWQELGAQVRKGEKSTSVVFWKFYGENEETHDNASGDDSDDLRRRCFARAYYVFNADQVDGFTVSDVSQLPDAERIQHTEDFFRNTGITIIEKGGHACYDLRADEIHMPPFPLFTKAERY
jgi:antirestriction protein ArdC